MLLLQVFAANAEALRIVTSIRPVHSLVAGVTRGISSPQLLIDQLQSPHDYQLKPSDIERLQQADLIIYAGPQIETFMQKILGHLAQTPVIALSQIDHMILLPGRALGHHHVESPQDMDSHRVDGHLWLSTRNAKVFVSHLVDVLGRLDPANAAGYRDNARQLLARLDQLHQDIAQRLAPVRNQPFIQFHDALQYFEHEFALSGGLFFTTGAEHKIGMKQLHNIRQQIIDRHIRCIYYEPPVIPPILHNLMVPGQTRLLPLEPIGIDFTPGADLYFQLMDNIAQQLEVCLKQQGPRPAK